MTPSDPIARARRAAGRVRRSIQGSTPPPPPPPAPKTGAHRPAPEVILESGLFDVAWYSRQVGRKFTPEAAVRHYLDQGGKAGRLPHPLIDPAHLREGLGGEEELGDRDPFTVYVRRRAWRVAPHPLFDAAAYVAAHPEALTHPGGPVGHYSEAGPAAGPANDWFTGDLGAWVRDRWEDWKGRQRSVSPALVATPPKNASSELIACFADAAVEPTGAGPVATVVVLAGYVPETLAITLASLTTQTCTSWEALVVVEDESDTGGVVPEVLAGRDHSVIRHPGGVQAGVAEAVRRARGEVVAFVAAGETWPEDRLRLAVAAMRENGSPAVADVLEVRRPDGTVGYGRHGLPTGRVEHRNGIELARLVVRRELAAEVGIGTELRAWDFDFVARLAGAATITTLPVVGPVREVRLRAEAQRPLRRWAHPAYPPIDTLTDQVLHARLVDWAVLRRRTPEPGVVTVIIPTYSDWEMTCEAVESVMQTEGDREIDCIVWDNGSPGQASVVLDSLPLRHDRVRVFHHAANLGFALGNDLALEHARGEIVVFLNNDTTVDPGWLTPLVRALDDPDVLGAQSLLLYPTGTVQSAGVAFPRSGGVPHAFLAGFPEEDAAGIDALTFHALTGAALAVRYVDAVAIGGFDAVFRNGMEDVDFCLRLAEHRPGHFVVLPDSRVIHHESRTEGRYRKFAQNRRVFLDRWRGRLPADDVQLWGSRGLRVVDHFVRAARETLGSLAIPEPVLVRESRLLATLEVTEAPARLRWAIKNPAPPGQAGEKWGDTHFARALAAGLRELGQEVVIDARPEFDRVSGRHDDVTVLLHGLAPYRPLPESVNLMWIISHPEMLSPRSAADFDRVLAASVSWSEETSRVWGRTIEPLLQATDPTLFHPDRADPDTGHPVLFVGGSRRQFRPIVKAAVENGLPLSVYGSEWKQFVHKRYLKGLYLDNLELGAAYRSAGVVLNDHWDDMRIDGFLSNRLFDAVASGARVITDDVAGLGSIFGDSVQVWRGDDDLVRLTSMVDPDEAFGDDDTRRAVAARIHKEHSFVARAQRLLEIALEERRRRGFDA
jgi:GT2 family glycosyltransferase